MAHMKTPLYKALRRFQGLRTKFLLLHSRQNLYQPAIQEPAVESRAGEVTDQALQVLPKHTLGPLQV